MTATTLPSQAYLCQRLNYDPATGMLRWRARPLSSFRSDRIGKGWNARWSGEVAGKIASDQSAIHVSVDYRRYYAHRLIWRMVTGNDPGGLVDHRNCNGLENWRGNLRLASHTENCWNNRGRVRDLPKGVYRMRNSFQAKIAVSGNTVFLGTFSSPQKAHAAYCEAADRLHGEFANHGR